ncbi:MAG: LysR family transcriptional regulator [Nannocystaceae bacterium]|nr:LysR family transcriptional regulator [Nannocystaceae bacterium]
MAGRAWRSREPPASACACRCRASGYLSCNVAAERLNYQHLLYFWTVAKAGGVGAAARRLHLAQHTVSGQLRALEQSLGARLFEREGRRLRLTALGQRVFEHADEIFALGDDIVRLTQAAASGQDAAVRERLVVGCADVLPKLLAFQLLEPALACASELQLVVRQDRFDRLLAELALHNLDLVLADAPVPPNLGVRAFNHRLGDSAVAVFAAPARAAALRRDFPASLDRAAMVLPSEHTALRAGFHAWCEARGLRPHVVAEFDDSALLKAFARADVGALVAPAVTQAELSRTWTLDWVGDCEALRAECFAITLERRLRHPAVVAICGAARSRLAPGDPRNDR